jgi:hypothetical protein
MIGTPKLDASFEDLHAAGCIQTGADTQTDLNAARKQFGGMWAGLMRYTAMNPCQGCPAFNNGRCAAFRQYNTGAKSTPVPPPDNKHPSGLSMRQIAEKLGISLSEARRRKVQGTLTV